MLVIIEPKSVLHRSIGCICFQFYLLLCTGDKHLIHWTCWLLLLVRGGFRFGILELVFVDVVVGWNSSQDSSYEGHYVAVATAISTADQQ